MPGGRPPTPTNALKLHGGVRESRHANRLNEIQPEGDAVMLDALDGEALKCWEFYHPRLIQMGLATEVDSAELTEMCIWWGEFMRWKAQPVTGINDYRRLMGMATASKQFRGLASKFGINPTDRVGMEGNVPTQNERVLAIIAGG